jgi:hypothetical protein
MGDAPVTPSDEARGGGGKPGGLFDPGTVPGMGWPPAGEAQHPVRLPLLAWDGPLFVHAPLDAPFDIAAIPGGGGHQDRWSRSGDAVIYLASDAGVALGELARHLEPGTREVRRRIVALQPRPGALRGLVDLRDPAIDRVLGIPVGTTWCFDRDLARDLAALLRADPRHRGLLVPSLAFPDQPERCNIVLFTDRLDGPFEDQLRTWGEVARIGAA